MASQTRTSAREEERRLNIRTLVIASVASATAAVVTSQFWVAGTWVAAALTPVLVTLISELLQRPTAAVAERVTSKAKALPPGRGSAEPGGERERPAQTREPAGEPTDAPVRVYRAGSDRPRGGKGTRSRKRIAVGVVAGTAVLAFAITAIAITGADLVTGGSIGKGDRPTTLWGGEDRSEKQEQERTTPTTKDEQKQDQEQDQQPKEKDQQETAPGQDGGSTAPEEEQPPTQTAPGPAPQVPEAPAPEQP